MGDSFYHISTTPYPFFIYFILQIAWRRNTQCDIKNYLMSDITLISRKICDKTFYQWTWRYEVHLLCCHIFCDAVFPWSMNKVIFFRRATISQLWYCKYFCILKYNENTINVSLLTIKCMHMFIVAEFTKTHFKL
jgi:hypothetical protein